MPAMDILELNVDTPNVFEVARCYQQDLECTYTQISVRGGNGICRMVGGANPEPQSAMALTSIRHRGVWLAGALGSRDNWQVVY